ncbi:alpha-ketoglutarate-dependent dioxygenase AlkB family protein [Aspergillus undulatus]|uniref:alpha-ketoglutarate-dependent dioxygenase AlkB family protein n=1 Tax=Aspergillus undulatus TaxID=1810928 RepID=UPI003CCD7436
MSKRTLESFYKTVSSKKLKLDEPEPLESTSTSTSFSHHPNYPHPIAHLSPSIANPLASIKESQFKRITNQPHLDLLYYHPLIPSPTARDLFQFLRGELPFYRVQYTIRRGGQTQIINTPRFTTVFGVDETSQFIPSQSRGLNDGSSPDGADADADAPETLTLVDVKTHRPVPESKYQYRPRPIPSCLDQLRKHVEAAIGDGSTYNFCLVNYYATGDDSISYHSDDERFLGANPSIASISLGAQRDFLLRHKPSPGVSNQPMKFALASGDMVVMRGETQSNWNHSVPKRRGGEAHKGRINITFRKAVVPGGTDNYYNYNVGSGIVYRWDEKEGKMVSQSAKSQAGSADGIN